MSNWNERGPTDSTPARDSGVRRPLDCSDDEFTRRLWAATDASIALDLRRYGEVRRWVIKPASGRDPHADDRSWSGLQAYARAARRDPPERRDTWDHLIDRRGHGDLGYDPREAGRKSWATRRARDSAASTPDG